MGWSMFIEETGLHQASLPYGALVGVAVEDRFIWQLVSKLKDAETHFFGTRLESLSSFFTVETLLSPELLNAANASPKLSPLERLKLTKQYFEDSNTRPDVAQLIAFAQSQKAYCEFVIGLLQDFQSKAFAVFSPIEESDLTYRSHLRKDYAFLFARFASFLTSLGAPSIGSLVLDPKRHKDDFVSIASITDYFEKTTNGRLRAKVMVPEPLMANPSLSTINQAAVLVSRVLSWGLRLPGMTHPRRRDLDDLIKRCNNLRISFGQGTGKKDWSFIFVDTIRPRQETA